MPTYDYECLKCGFHFEKFQKMTDAPRKRCPQCKGKVRRLISSGSGLIFKGSGFYSTDYKKSRPRPCEGCDAKKDGTCDKSNGKKDAPKQKESKS